MKLHNAVTNYITYRKTLGERFLLNEVILKMFIRTINKKTNLSDVTSKQVHAFLYGNGPITTSWRIRHRVVRDFYCYVISRGYVLKSPVPTVIPKITSTFVPYIYSYHELRLLFDAALTYQKKRALFEPSMLRQLLLLVYGAGLRINEALSLKLIDVNLVQSLLTIRETKFFKSRLVPLGRQLTQALSQYAARRAKKGYSQDPNAPFFIGRNKKAINKNTFQTVFKRIREKSGLHRSDGSRYQPRLHDLRHSFAVHRLTKWYQQGADVQNLLPVLSVYMGHQNLSATSVYLTMTPTLLHQANLRFENYVLKEDAHD